MHSKKRTYIKTLYSSILGLVLGGIYAIIEYYSKHGSENQVVFIPLLLRALTAGVLFFVSISYAGRVLNRKLKKNKFIPSLIIHSVVYSLIIAFILLLINVVWFLLNPQYSLGLQWHSYFNRQMFLINMVTVFPGMMLIIAFSQILSLHRKGDLLNFVLGRFNNPLEVERVFCFADLKGSTSIAEILGHLKYAEFLKTYFSDIAEAVSNADAQIYQYVGDEIVLTWPYNKAIKNNNCIDCVFEMKAIIQKKKQEYMRDYGFVPYFRAALHGGKVVVSWVGRERKEIVYIGDVVNTTSRIQSECKRLGKDFLISGHLLDKLDTGNGVDAQFIEETIPRGKASKVKLYCLEEQ